MQARHFRACVDKIYLAAAENVGLAHFETDIAASPIVLASLFSSTSLKAFKLQLLDASLDFGFAPQLTLAQGRALAAGFSNNVTLKRVELLIKAEAGFGADELASTALSGLQRHPRLQELVVYTNTRENDSNVPACIARILETVPTLEEVKFNREDHEDDNDEQEEDTPVDFSPIFRVSVPAILKRLTFIAVAFTSDPISSRDSELIVTHVSLEHCAFESSNSLIILANLAPGIQTLRIMDCHGLAAQIPAPAVSGPFEQIVGKHPMLKKLRMGSLLENRHMPDIVRALSRFHSIETLEINIDAVVADALLLCLRNNHGLRRLSLRVWHAERLNNGDALAQMLRANNTLTSLQLYGNYAFDPMNDGTVSGLCDGLRQNNTLRRLELSSLSPNGLVELAGVVGSESNSLTHLEMPIRLNVTEAAHLKAAQNQLIRSIGSASGLKCFSNSRTCPLDMETAFLSLAAAKQNPSLENIDFKSYHSIWRTSPELTEMKRKLQFQLRVNHFRRTLSNFPFRLWPIVLNRMAGDYERHNIRYYFLNEVIGKLGREPSNVAL